MVDAFDDGEDDTHAWANFNTIRREIPAHQIYDNVAASEDCAMPSLLQRFYPIRDHEKFNTRTTQWLRKILAGLAHCVASGELYPGLYAWNEKLMSYLQEFGFRMPRAYVKKLIVMYVTILTKFPSRLKDSKNEIQNAVPKTQTTAALLIPVKQDFRAILILAQTLNTLLQIPKTGLIYPDFKVSRDVVFALFHLVRYLKFDSELRKVLDTEHNTSLQSKAGSAVAETCRRITRFIDKVDMNDYIRQHTSYAIHAAAKHIYMPNYEECIWYTELIMCMPESRAIEGRHDFFHNQIFPLLWNRYPKFKVLDDRTIYLLNLYLPLELPNMSHDQCSQILDLMLSSLIVRLRLPIGQSRRVQFCKDMITSDEIRNFSCYANTLINLCAHLPKEHGMAKLCDFFRATQNFFYITNAESARAKSANLLFSLLKDFSSRIHELRRRQLYPHITERDDWPLPVISDEKIDMFVEIVLHLVDYSIFSSYNALINDSLHYLAVLKPETVLPFVWKKIFHHLNTYTSSSESESIIQPILKTSFWTILPTLFHKIDHQQIANIITSVCLNIDPRNEVSKTNIAILLLKKIFSLIGPISVEHTPILAESAQDFFSSFITVVLPDYELSAANTTSGEFTVSEEDQILYYSLIDSFLQSLAPELQAKCIARIGEYLLKEVAISTHIFLLTPVGALNHDMHKEPLYKLVEQLLGHAHRLVQPTFTSPPDAFTSISKPARYGFKLLIAIAEQTRWQTHHEFCNTFFNLIQSFSKDTMSENLDLRAIAFETIETILSSFYLHYEAFVKDPSDYREGLVHDLKNQISESKDDFTHAYFQDSGGGVAMDTSTNLGTEVSLFKRQPEFSLKLHPFRSFSVLYKKVNLPRKEFIQRVYDHIFKGIEENLLAWANGTHEMSKNVLKFNIEVYGAFAKTFFTHGGYGPKKQSEEFNVDMARKQFASAVEYPYIECNPEDGDVQYFTIDPIGDRPCTYFVKLLEPVMNRLMTDLKAYPDQIRKECLETVLYSIYNPMLEELGYLPINPDEFTNSRQASVIQMHKLTLFTTSGIASLLRSFCMCQKSTNRTQAVLLPYSCTALPPLLPESNSWLRKALFQILQISRMDTNRTTRIMGQGYLGLLTDSYGPMLYDEMLAYLVDTVKSATTEDEVEMALQLSSELLAGLLAKRPFKTLLSYLPSYFALPHHDRKVGNWQDIFANACVEPLQTFCNFSQATHLYSDGELRKITDELTSLHREIVTDNGITRVSNEEYQELLTLMCQLLMEHMNGESYKITCCFDIILVLVHWHLFTTIPQPLLEAMFAIACQYAVYLEDQQVVPLAHDLIAKLCWISRDSNPPTRMIGANGADAQRLMDNIQFKEISNEDEYSQCWFVDDKAHRGVLLGKEFGVQESSSCKIPDVKVYSYPKGHQWPRPEFKANNHRIFEMLTGVILEESFITNYFMTSAEVQNSQNDARVLFKRLSVFLGGQIILKILPKIIELGKMSDEKKNYNKLGCAMVVGIGQGSRHWSYAHACEADRQISSYFLSRVEQKDTVVYKEWNNLFSNRDARRFQWAHKTAFALLDTDPATWLEQYNETLLYAKLTFLHQIVAVGKHRTDSLCKRLCEQIYTKKDTMKSFLSHTNPKIRNIFVIILNNVMASTFAKVITPEQIQDVFLYALDFYENDVEKQRTVLKPILRFCNSYLISVVYQYSLHPKWLMHRLMPYIYKHTYLLHFTPPDPDLNKWCLGILRKICTRTEHNVDRLHQILEHVFFNFRQQINPLEGSLEALSISKSSSFNITIAMLNFLPIYCWGNIFIIKARPALVDKILEFLVAFLVNNKSPEVRKSAADAICSLTSATIFQAAPILRRLKELKTYYQMLVDVAGRDSCASPGESSSTGSISPKRLRHSSNNAAVTSGGDDASNGIITPLQETPSPSDSEDMSTSFCSTASRSKYTRRQKRDMDGLHGIVLGFCALIQSVPYDVPDWLPPLILYLNPLAYSKNNSIKTSIRKAVSEFKKTHAIAWETIHKEKFTEEQLEALNDMSLNYTYFT